MDRSSPKPFQLFAGHPALELVNTLDMRFSENPIELLPTYSDLLRLLAQMRLLPAEQVRTLGRSVPGKTAKRVLASVMELREALSGVLYAWVDGEPPTPERLKILEKYFHGAALQRHLHAEQSHLQWRWPPAGQDGGIALWILAQSAADLLLSSDAELVKVCGDPSCRWLFLDVSKNHTRRWCDMKTCGNRMKARRHQARLQETPL